MAQQVTAIMFGARVNHCDIFDDEEFEGPAETWSGEDADALRTSDVDDVVGFVVAIGAGSIEGVPSIDASVLLDTFAKETPFKQSLARAQENWQRFRTHARRHNVKNLPDGECWLAIIEVA